MFTSNAISRGLRHPIFTVDAGLHYLLLGKDLRYIKEKLAEKYSRERLKDFSVGASAGIKEVSLYLMIKKFKPKLMIETGVANGVSTYFILKAMKQNGIGRLISIDLPNYKEGGYITSEGQLDKVFISKSTKPGWIVPEGFRDIWTLKLGRSSDVLPKLKVQPDAFMHDSEHSYKTMSFELEWAIKHMKEGVILCDDSNVNNAYSDFCKRHNNRVKEIASPLSVVRLL
jgi:hypothetical protein